MDNLEDRIASYFYQDNQPHMKLICFVDIKKSESICKYEDIED